MSHRIYFLRNTNESDNPDAAEHATLEVHGPVARYASTSSSGEVLVVQGNLPRHAAALYLWRARERGWAIKRYSATPGNACRHA